MTPIIGISTNLHTVDKGKFLGMERIYVNKDYIDAVVKAGGIPLLLPPVADRASIVRYAEVCDGFILSGGGDINPILYGDFPHPCLEEFHTGLDRAQWAYWAVRFGRISQPSAIRLCYTANTAHGRIFSTR